ncbi:MAG: hypothetical protein ABL897_00095 [Hyphomicrobium sp.]
MTKPTMFAVCAAVTLATAISAAPSLSFAAGPQAGTRIKSNVTPTPGWYCIIWEKMSDGRWVCRLQEKRS